MIEIRQQQLIEVPRSRVFRALLDPRDLGQWFCDTAQVEPRPGGRYAFSGPHAYGAAASGTVTRLDPDRALSYVWPLAGSDTTVTFELDDAEGKTKLAVIHTGVVALPIAAEWPKEHLTVVWVTLLRQLASHLAGRPVPRYDFTCPTPPVVDHEIMIDAPVERVWLMLTTPAELNRWMAKDAYVELRAGGRYSYGWPKEDDRYGTEQFGPQRILALEPPHRLVISWVSEGGFRGTITWTLAEVDQGRTTRMRLIHEGLAQTPGVLRDYHLGWWEFLTGLQYLAEGDLARVARR